MSLGLINLTQNNRDTLCTCIIFFNVVQIILGFVLFILGVQTDIVIWKLTQAEKREINTVFLAITLLGILVIVNDLICIKIVIKGLRLPYKSTGKYVFYWIILGLLVVLNGLLYTSICMKTSKSLAEQIKTSLFRGLGQYLTDPTWHEILDEMQQYYSCCGSESFVDWHQTPWIMIDFLVEDSETVLKFAEPDARILPPVTPWSCCRSDYALPCFHDPIQQAHFSEVWAQPRISLDGIYQQGCASIITLPFSRTLNAFMCIIVLLFLIQILIIILLRLLYTSARNAVVLGNIETIAPGWVIGRGDFGVVGGPPLTNPQRDREGGAQKKHKRKHDAIADLSIRPGDELESQVIEESHVQHKQTVERRGHSPMSQFSSLKSKMKSGAGKAKTCVLVKLESLKKSHKTHGRAGRKQPESSSDEEKRKSPKVEVLMTKKTKRQKKVASSTDESQSSDRDRKVDARKRKLALKSKPKRKTEKNTDRSDRSPLIKKKHKK